MAVSSQIGESLHPKRLGSVGFSLRDADALVGLTEADGYAAVRLGTVSLILSCWLVF